MIEKKKIWRQLFLEFYIQIILSIVWACYRLYLSKPADDKVSVFVSNFMASLFFLSWLFGQYIRVKKQQKIESEFGGVRSNLSSLLNKIELQTKDLIGFSTGGESIAYFQPIIMDGSSTLTLGLTNSSEYPVFDFSGEWIDLDEKIDMPNGKFWTRNRFALGNIYPHRIMPDALSFNLLNKAKLNLNIFITTRNRSITQLIRVVRQDNKLIAASKVTSDGFEKIFVPSNFPGYDQNDLDKIFK